MSRVPRVESLLKQEIAKIILTKLEDTRVGFVSVTDLEVSPDYKEAKVYFSVLGSQTDINKSLIGLTSAVQFIRGELGKVLRMQTIPKLTFIYDDSLKRGVELSQKIDALGAESSAQ
jgi:ribosome-binding factor A